MIPSVDPHDMGRIAWSRHQGEAFDEPVTTAGGLAALDSAMSDASQLAKDAATVSMFDAFGGAEKVAPDAPKNDGNDQRHDLPKAEVLALEHEVLGFYLSGHPLEERAGLVSLLSSCPIRNLDELSQSGGGQVRIAGLVLQKAELVVKSGKMAGAKMCRFRLEDLSGSVSVTCFPRTYADARDIIEDGAVLLVKGKLGEGSDEPILLDDVFSLSDALSRFRGGLETTSSRATSRSSGLKEPDRNRGESPLYLQTMGDDGMTRRVKANRGQGVAIEFATELCSSSATTAWASSGSDRAGWPGPQSPPVAPHSRPARIAPSSPGRTHEDVVVARARDHVTVIPAAASARRARRQPGVEAVVVFRVIKPPRGPDPAARARSRGRTSVSPLPHGGHDVEPRAARRARGREPAARRRRRPREGAGGGSGVTCVCLHGITRRVGRARRGSDPGEWRAPRSSTARAACSLHLALGPGVSRLRAQPADGRRRITTSSLSPPVPQPRPPRHVRPARTPPAPRSRTDPRDGRRRAAESAAALERPASAPSPSTRWRCPPISRTRIGSARWCGGPQPRRRAARRVGHPGERVRPVVRRSGRRRQPRAAALLMEFGHPQRRARSRLEPIMEAPLPIGPTRARWQIRVVEYPQYRMARAGMGMGRSNGAFTLFRRISDRDIAMTAPVE